MYNMQSFWIICFLIALAATALAIECYSCESVYETDCGDDFDSKDYWKISCSQIGPPRYLLVDLAHRNATACMKKIYKESNVRRVLRSCFFGDINDTDIGCRTDPSMLGVTDIDCLVCNNENYCNAAHREWPESMITWPQMLSSLCFVLLARLGANL